MDEGVTIWQNGEAVNEWPTSGAYVHTYKHRIGRYGVVVHEASGTGRLVAYCEALNEAIDFARTLSETSCTASSSLTSSKSPD